MLTWEAFEAQQPELAAFGKVRLALPVMYLGTVRADGYPRVHPVTAFVGCGRLFTFMEPASPKAKDLQRNPRFAMHSLVLDGNGTAGEFVLSGQARLIDDPAQRAAAAAVCPYRPKDRYILFEFSIERCMINQYTDGNPNPRHWKCDEEAP